MAPSQARRPRLLIAPADERPESEACQVAHQVPAMPASGRADASIPVGPETEASVTAVTAVTAVTEATEAPPAVGHVLASAGKPLDSPLRRSMEQHLGHDFSQVRIHSDIASDQSARQIDARAYTSGHHIVFAAGHFAPASPTGRQLLAHELAHVLQQAKGPSDRRFGLVQRDKQHAPAPPSQDEKEALTNFKNDWRNNFSHYEKIIKLGAITYSPTQKEGIKATKGKGSVDITLGKPFADQAEDEVRWTWIKAEVIDKTVQTDRFEDLAYDPTHATIKKIAPPSAAGQYCALNCPATAAALDTFLRTGAISPAVCNLHKETTPGYGFDISKDTFGTSVDWKHAAAAVRAKLKKHGDFVIVEATRSEKQQKDSTPPLAPTHYFSIVKIKDNMFAIDAFGGGILSDDIDNYVTQRAVASTYRIVKGAFTVREIIPK